jgi:hypothetical protein
MRILAHAIVFQLIAQKMHYTAQLLTLSNLLTQMLTLDLTLPPVFAYKWKLIAFQDSTGMKSTLLATAHHMPAHSTTTGTVTSACANATQRHAIPTNSGRKHGANADIFHSIALKTFIMTTGNTLASACQM